MVVSNETGVCDIQDSSRGAADCRGGSYWGGNYKTLGIMVFVLFFVCDKK